MNKCLYCYKELDNTNDFHSSCSKSFFGTIEAPILDYTLEQMDELAKQVIERSVRIPGVQPKLSMSIINEATSSNTSGHDNSRMRSRTTDCQLAGDSRSPVHFPCCRL